MKLYSLYSSLHEMKYLWLKTKRKAEVCRGLRAIVSDGVSKVQEHSPVVRHRWRYDRGLTSDP